MILGKQMLILFFFMFLGYGMAKKNILDGKISAFLSWLIVNVANPALVLSGSIGNRMERGMLCRVFVLAILFYVLLIAASEIAVTCLHVEKKDAGMYKTLLVFTNVGFMGFPILSATYGGEALLYGAVFLLIFNLLIYTYGIFRIAGSVGSFAESMKKCANIGVLAGILSVILSVFQIRLPDGVNQTITMLSNLTAPLSMMVIGASFLEVPWNGLGKDRKLLLFAALRLLLFPALGMLGLRMFVKDPILLGVCFVTLATPSGSMTAMLARQYGGDYVTASKGIGFTTLLSVVTMPLLFQIFHLG